MLNSHKQKFHLEKSYLKKIFLILIVVLSVINWGCAKASKKPKPQPKPKAQTAAVITYGSKIQPLLSQKCTECHKPNGPVSSIQLDTYDHVMKYIKPKDPSHSQLIQAVDGGTMSSKVTNADVQLLKTWVTQGAKK